MSDLLWWRSGRNQTVIHTLSVKFIEHYMYTNTKVFWYDTGTFCRLPIMSSIKENLSGFIMIQQSHTHTSSTSTYTIYIYMYIASSILCKTTKSDPLWVWGWNYGSEAETMGLRLKLWVWGWDYGSEAETMGPRLRLWVWGWNYGSGTETFALQVMKSLRGRGAGKEASDYGHTFTLWHTHTHVAVSLVPRPCAFVACSTKWWSMDNPWIHCINKLLGWLIHWLADDPWIIHGYTVFLSYCVRGRVLSLATLTIHA